jgi:hypothetical protein
MELLHHLHMPRMGLDYIVASWVLPSQLLYCI